MKLVRAIRAGRIKTSEEKAKEAREAMQKPRFYDIWAENSDNETESDRKMHIPAPKMALPGNSFFLSVHSYIYAYIIYIFFLLLKQKTKSYIFRSPGIV